jgi:hypothetical protein
MLNLIVLQKGQNNNKVKGNSQVVQAKLDGASEGAKQQGQKQGQEQGNSQALQAEWQALKTEAESVWGGIQGKVAPVTQKVEQGWQGISQTAQKVGNTTATTRRTS